MPVCWQCGKDARGEAFCRFCNALQPPKSEYYEFFGFPRRLSLDLNDLQSRFYTLSRLLHPDRFTRKPERERGYSLEATSILNDAYRTLREPVSRAEYVLKQEGLDIGEQRSKDVPPELLEEVFELNMALEELRHGDEDARAPLQLAREKFVHMRDEIDSELGGLFDRFDETQDRAVLNNVRAALNRRRYIRNLVDEVDKELARSGQIV